MITNINELKLQKFKEQAGNVFNHISDNARDGGFTVHPETMGQPKMGYAVGGIKTFTYRDTPNDHDYLAMINDLSTYEGLTELCAARQALQVKHNGTLYIGGWLDNDTMLYYFDIVEIIPNKHEAIEAAAMRGEKAIYDLDKQVEIKIFKEGVGK